MRELEPPEPITAVFQALKQLPDSSVLKMIHRREPVPLYEMLQQMGYESRCFKRGDDLYVIYIWKAGQQAALQAYAREIAREQETLL